MSGDSRWEHDSLPLEALERINRVCVQFEAVWKGEQEPRIEDYLGSTEGEERAVLLRELLLLDLDYRWRLDRPATAEDYRARFPQDRELILGRLSTRTILGGRGARGGPGRAYEPRQFPSQLGDYELIEMLGEGGMGTVFRARQPSAHRTVALKVVRPDRVACLSPDRMEETVRRFEVEIQAAAQLEHESIVPVYEVGQIEGHPYFSMRYFEGGSLDSVIRQGPLDGREAASVVETIARAIQHAHSHGVIHRDLKPRNILLDSHGHPYVGDFGLAKSREIHAELTLSGEVIGTPAYMAPEQAKGEGSVGMAADIYGLGATLYELITGRPPFRAATIAETQRQVIDNNPVPPRDLNPAIRRDLETICLKCLEKEPRNRYGSAEEVAEELVRFRQRRPIKARPIGRVQRFWRWCRRNPLDAGLSVAVAVLLVILGVGGPLVAVKQGSLRWLAEESAESERKAREAEAKQRRIAERRLYFARVLLARKHWEAGLIVRTRELLSHYCSAGEDGQEDPRGWEWDYLNALCHQEAISFQGHAGSVRCVAWSPDGQKIVSAGEDRVLRIWSLVDEKEVDTWDGHSASVRSVRWRPDGDEIASVDEDGEVRLWHVHDGTSTVVALEGSLHARCLAWSQDGARLAIGGNDKTVRIWDIGGKRVVATLGPLESGIESVAWSPDGSRLAAGHGDEVGERDLTVWRVSTWEKDVRLDVAVARPVADLDWSADATGIAIPGPHGRVSVIYPWLDRRTALLRPCGDVNCVRWSPCRGERLMATAGSAEIIRVFDVDTGEVRTKLHGHTGPILSLAWSANGERLASCSEDGTVKIWDARRSGEAACRRIFPNSVEGLSWAPDGRRLGVSYFSSSATIWDTSGQQSDVRLTSHPNQTLCIAWNPNGKTIANSWGRVRSCVRIHDASGRSVADLPEHGDVQCVAWSPKGTHLASLTVKKLTIWDPESAEKEKQFDGPGYIARAGLAWNPRRSHWIASPRRLGDRVSVSVWDTRTGTTAYSLQADASNVISVDWDSEGNRLVAGEQDGTIRAWDVDSNKAIFAVHGHAGPVNCVAWSPDGSRIASSSMDGMLKIRDPDSGEEIFTFHDPRGGIFALAWSPDGTKLAAGSQGPDNSIVRVFDARPGHSFQVFRPPPARRSVEAVHEEEGGLGDWPQFAFDGRNTAFNPHETRINVSNVSQLRPLWTHRTGSTSYANSVVVDGIVYHSDYSSWAVALRASSGRVLWRREVSGSSGGATIARGIAYFASRHEGHMYAFKADSGADVWNRPLDGTNHAPATVHEDVVYVGTKTGTLYALGAASGETIWTFSTGGKLKTPSVAYGKVFICSEDGNLYAVDIASGEKIWNVAIGHAPLSVAVQDNLVYAGMLEGGIYGFDGNTGKHVMTGVIEEAAALSPALAEGKIYIAAGDSSLYCFDAKTGERLWAAPVDGVVIGRPFVANGVVYAANRIGDVFLYAFNAKTGERLLKYPLYKSMYGTGTTPIVAGGRVYMTATWGRALIAFHIPPKASE